MNYNNWFFNQYKYLKGKDGEYNDTKWVNMVERYKALENLEESTLMDEQPFGVMSNNYGFDQLLELLGRSNYTFEDINKSLIDTYNVSLKNAMGSMLVNTQSVIFHTKNTDSRNVFSDRTGKYYIVEAPFNQMHFGYRDEFIRQRLHSIHTTENGYYIDIKDFNSKYITDVLGFTMICTVNGLFCNDCKVCVDDKGFKFKIKWGYSSDVNFILYKLDDCFVHEISVDTSMVTSIDNKIPSSEIKDIIKEEGLTGSSYKCILNIHDPVYDSSTPTYVNFGLISSGGLSVLNIQKKTLEMLERNKSSKVNITIYALRYFHEVPNLYPSMNYYDMINSEKVYDDKYEKIKDKQGNQIVMTSEDVYNKLEICTPPISLDRSSTVSFNTIMKCFDIEATLKSIKNLFSNVGSTINMNNLDGYTVQKNIIIPLEKILKVLKECYITYGKASMLTALVPRELVNQFSTLITGVQNTLNKARELFASTDPNVDYNQISMYGVPEFYGDNYLLFISAIVSPFSNDKLSLIYNMKDLPKNYYVTDNSNRFNRPVSEQCFITIKYDFDQECWLFDYPEIKHFHGISNTFYINNGMTGNEIYKFFVLYTDTKNPSEKTVDPLTEEQVFDFDKFVEEVNKHMGYIKYWNAENKLMKYSKILFNRYDQDTCIQVLSKILKRKLIADDILQQYPSDMDYELSSIQSFGYENYDEDSTYAPFAVNFLFYTLAMMHSNEDKLQTYFVNTLVNNKYSNRFIDVDLGKTVDQSLVENINLSTFVIAPTRIDASLSNIPTDSEYNTFYGIPGVFTSQGAAVISEVYRNVFDVYDDEREKWLINDVGLDTDYYAKYDPTNLNNYNYIKYTYNNDIWLAKLFSKYMTMVYAYQYELQTSYAKTFNQTSTCESAIERCNQFIDEINKYVNDNSPLFAPSSTTVANMITTDNEFITLMRSLQAAYDKLVNLSFEGTNTKIFNIINDLLCDIRRVFYLFGYDNYALKPVRALYIHLKKINKRMNLYEFQRWLGGIDYLLIARFNDILASNPNIDISDQIFPRYARMIEAYILQCRDQFDVVKELIASFDTTFWTNHMAPIVDHCELIINTYTFDMFGISEMSYDDSPIYSTKPKYVMLNTTSSDPHFIIPTIPAFSENRKLIFYTKTDSASGGYKITSLRSICEYCMFDGSDVTLTGNVLDENGTSLRNITVDFKFVRVGSTSDRGGDTKELPNVLDSYFDFQSIHETYDFDNQGKLFNKERTPMNYEMFVGNKFMPLDSIHEMVMDTDPHDPAGPINRLSLSNQVLNSIALNNYANHDGMKIYFKPSHVKHLEPNANDVVTSVGGRYAVGQRIYLYAKDTGFVFPATITRIDSSEAHGFLEADVDSYNSKWFELTDMSLLDTYLTTDIECGVIDDNISNFMDEFNEGSYNSYDIIEMSNNISNDDDVYTMCGDPIYVANNAPYVYTRLNYFFSEDIPNRFIDEDHKMYHMKFIGYDEICDDNRVISINMISHDYNEYSDPELFPILRKEPNDHEIWDEEKRVFNVYKSGGYVTPDQFVVGSETTRDWYEVERERYFEMMENAETKQEYDQALLMFEYADLRYHYYDNFTKRLDYMIRQDEKPTTWYNVYSYDATEVYVRNGRAKPFMAFIPNINYISFTDDVDVYIYDWEHKHWLDPSTYTMSVTTVDGVKFNQPDNFKTNEVQYKLDITFDQSVEVSQKLLIYFGYNKSDIYDNIQLNDKTCYVRFKPIISTAKYLDTESIYSMIKIRKHFDGSEVYSFDECSTGENISVESYYKIDRPNRSGKYMYAPVIRMRDLVAKQSSNEYQYTDFELYIPSPFKDITTTRGFKRPSYTATIHQPIDSFVDGEHIKLICVSNGPDRWYDGNVSSIMFEAITSEENGSPKLTITKSSLDYITSGTYVCTVFESPEYSSVGGVITVTVSTSDESIYDGDWVKIPDDMVQYHDLPNKFILVPKANTINVSNPVTFEFTNIYTKYSDDVITPSNDDNNPFEYYYDSKNNVKLPISNVRNNNHKERLVINTSTNPDVKLIKSTYVALCRYSLGSIPKDGFIDVTGFIPSPLSRDRYEFYVNGRNITNTEHLHILSPTTIQLTNLRSLRNFELLELVDDVNESYVFKEGSVYVALNGDAFATYRQMMLSNHDVTRQDIRYMFNVYLHDSIHDYTNGFIDNPNNVNEEEDILNGITEDAVTAYDQCFNLPSINGVTLLHLTNKDIGLIEIPSEKILTKFDDTWKRERLTNPYFMKTHFVDNERRQIVLQTTDADNLSYLLQYILDDMICVHITGNMTKYFSLYISNSYTGKIDDVANTLKIIPFVKSGMYVVVSKDYAGKWLHATYDDAKPIVL